MLSPELLFERSRQLFLSQAVDLYEDEQERTGISNASPHREMHQLTEEPSQKLNNCPVE